MSEEHKSEEERRYAGLTTAALASAGAGGVDPANASRLKELRPLRH